jgi:hypothetical protein
LLCEARESHAAGPALQFVLNFGVRKKEKCYMMKIVNRSVLGFGVLALSACGGTDESLQGTQSGDVSSSGRRWPRASGTSTVT